MANESSLATVQNKNNSRVNYSVKHHGVNGCPFSFTSVSITLLLYHTILTDTPNLVVKARIIGKQYMCSWYDFSTDMTLGSCAVRITWKNVLLTGKILRNALLQNSSESLRKFGYTSRRVDVI